MDNDITVKISKLDYTLPTFEENYSQVLNLIHYDIDNSVLKHELLDYAARIGMVSIVEAVLPTNIGIEGKIAYCLNRGAKLKESSIDKVRNILSSYENKPEKETDFTWESILLSSNGRTVLAYVDCYSYIDNAKTCVLKGKLPVRELAGIVRKIVNDKSGGKSAVVKQLLEHYKEALVDSKKDSTTAGWVKPLVSIVDTLGLMVNNRASVKASAKGAKARKMSRTLAESDRKGEKAAAKVTYKDEDLDLGINSIDPTNLVGADAAVIYNTKTRHCEVYFAEANKKLSVQGSRIINFDQTVSIGKTLRKPETVLPHWNRATNVRRLQVLLGQVNGKSWNLSGKFNRNTMLIKVL